MIKVNKFNTGIISNLKKTKLAKRGLALALAATTVGSLAGCSKSHVLKDTVLDETIVATVNDDIAILKPLSSKIECATYIEGATKEHTHYFDIINGQWITDSSICVNKGVVLKNAVIERQGSIFNYLTKDEMLKANKNELNDEDVIAIAYRIKESYQEEPKKVLSK